MLAAAIIALNETPSVKERIEADCLRLLTQREHSRKELFVKLSAKGYSAELIRYVIDECVNKNWQSDRRYAENYTRQRLQKGFGSVRIQYELNQRGVDTEQVSVLIDDLAEREMTILEQLYLKKYSAECQLDAKEWAKRYRFLAQRGFSANSIHQLVKRLQLRVK